jgi:oligopeptide transport system substrate-binding protein
MNNIKKITLTTTALTAALLLTACGNSAASKNIQFGLTADISTLDSTMATDSNSWELIGSTQQGLMKATKNNSTTNALAQNISVSKDGLTYTITLKPNLKWSNGDPLTAQNFVYAWQRANDPKIGAEYAYLFAGVVKNASQIQAGKLPVATLGIKATSSNQLIITLEKPVPYFNYLLTMPVTFPLDQNFVEKEGKNYGTSSANTVYSGAYKFTQGNQAWTGTNKNYSIVKNPNFYDKNSVKSKEIDFQSISNPNTAAELYKQGKLDFAIINTNDLEKANKKDHGYTVITPAETSYIEYNQTGTNKALSNQNIREAINLATNRTMITNQFSPSSKTASSIAPQGFSETTTGQDFGKYVSQAYSYNPEKAKALFDEGLKEIGKKSVSLTLESSSDSSFSTEALPYLQTSLQKNLPGLTVNEKLVPSQQLWKDLPAHNFDMALTDWIADYSEPTTFYQLFQSGSSSNEGGFSNSAFDKAYNAATTTDVLNPKARELDYKAAETALFNQSNINPISYGSLPALINPKLTNLGINPSGIPYDLTSAYFK